MALAENLDQGANDILGIPHDEGILDQGRSFLSTVAEYARDKVAGVSEKAAAPTAAAALVLGGAGGVALKLLEAGTAQADPLVTVVAAKSQPAGVSLKGPLSDVVFGTKYTYDTSVTSNTTYAHALVSLFVPSSTTPREIKETHLVAHHPWRGTFTETYQTTYRMNEGLDFTVQAMPPHHGYRPLFEKVFPVTAAPGQTPPTTTTPPPGFGG